MVERGATPEVSPLHKRALKGAQALTTPLVPDDYIALINPMWSTRELHGADRARSSPRPPDAATVVVRPTFPWPGHRARPVPADRRRDRRHPPLARLLADLATPSHPDGLVSITVKHVDEGKMSPYFTRQAEPGSDRLPRRGRGRRSASPTRCREKLLFISAGSGITPILSMLRELERRDAPRRRRPRPLRARTEDDVIFGDHLRRHGRAPPRLRPARAPHRRAAAGSRRGDLDELCPDWRERETFLSGPRELLDAIEEHWERAGDPERLHMERFQPVIGEATPRTAPAAPSASASPTSRRPATRRVDPRRRRGGRRRAPVRLPDGDLPHLRRQLARGTGARPAHRRGARRGGRDGPHLRQRARGPRRDRPMTGAPMNASDQIDRTRCTGSAPSRSRRSARSSRRSTTRSTPTSASATRVYIRSIIQFHRRLAALSRIVLMASRYKPAWLLGTTGLSVAKILENMEIGHNVLHGQWDWMNDPTSTPRPGTGTPPRPPSAWKHSHNYVHHTYTNIVGKDKDVGYEIMRVDPKQKWHPVYLLQPFYNVLLMASLRVGRRRPRPRLRGDPQGQEAEGAAPRRAQGRSAARRAARSSRTTSPSRR